MKASEDYQAALAIDRSISPLAIFMGTILAIILLLPYLGWNARSNAEENESSSAISSSSSGDLSDIEALLGVSSSGKN
jgi:hypothetical protein